MMTHRFVLSAALLVATVASSQAQSLTYHVSLNTTPLTSSAMYTAPYSLDFQFFDGGDTDPEPSNTATFSNFVGQGNTIAPFSLSDGFPPFSGEDVVDFTPGSTISFTVNITTNEEIGSAGPDVLSLLLLDNDNTIDTTDPSGGNTFVSITESTDPANPAALTTAAFDAASGPSFSPTISLAGAGTAPEPGVLPLLAGGLVALPVVRRRLRRRLVTPAASPRRSAR